MGFEPITLSLRDHRSNHQATTAFCKVICKQVGNYQSSSFQPKRVPRLSTGKKTFRIRGSIYCGNLYMHAMKSLNYISKYVSMCLCMVFKKNYFLPNFLWHILPVNNGLFESAGSLTKQVGTCLKEPIAAYLRKTYAFFISY